ncbi:glycoside hydrolase [Acutalibacter sp. 1XD8-33]|uniref:family 43 glycosylhydrolase n=1 Tax=Acutalibacter sp. 1XD8-33 TaxID=2320081 RepID=UPI000EA1706B|nr:family 43 glycosylhydrolase [Acutalibacter sp. 1XD8-33]RKJ40794.1 glycoside hydrolase [Acutalibacter sp. 1XD8-33]
MELFYNPKNAVVGDVIPFYDNGQFKPFYLRGNRGYFGEDSFGGWTMLTTQDHLHFTETPTGIRGGTGSVLLVDGVYHLFYCTFKQNPKRETICHAISRDLKAWEPIPEDSFTADGKTYQLTDWRDPFVFWNEEAGEWWMLVAAKETGKTARTGCTALCASKDLHSWEYRPPFYAPHMHMSAHECPDLFKMGDWYYLIYSQYTDRFQTYYRMSKSLCGPWIAPARDSFDTRCFYAAKSGTDGKDRYLYGWNPTRHYNNWGFNPPIHTGYDYNSFDWGGAMIVHRLVQNPDGTLAVTVPESVDSALQIPNSIPMQPQNGPWTTGEDWAKTDNPCGYSSLLLENRVPDLCKLEMDLVFSETIREIGVAVQVDEQFGVGYYLSLMPHKGRLEWKSGLRMYDEGGWTFPYDVEMERPIELAPNQPHKLRIFVQDTILLAYLDDQVALNTRMFDYSRQRFGLYASDGQAEFRNIRLWT